MKRTRLCCLGLLFCTFIPSLLVHAQQSKVIIAYVFGTGKVINPNLIDAAKLTHINYAFVNIKDGVAWLESPENDTINFAKLNDLKKINPNLKLMISIGGWTWSKNFSDASLSDSSRRVFAQSAAAIVDKYVLDGIDIDWEYPGMRGDNNVFRPEDKQNYTLLFKELRSVLDSLQRKNQKTYQLTTATGGFHEYLEHTEMAKAQQYLDYINIMTYDFKTGGAKTAGHHTNLYSQRGDPEGRSSDQAVKDYIKAGVLPNKIVLGVAFYGRAWKTAGMVKNGLNDSVVASARGGGYTRLKDSIINMNGYNRHWDRQAKAPYLYNKKEQIFISYDDEKSIKAKCRYINKKELAGIMFWEYFSDPKNYLLTVIDEHLK